MLSAANQHLKESAARRFGLLVVAVLIGAAVAFGAIQLTRPSAQPNTKAAGQGVLGPGRPTVDRPFMAPSATQVSMVAATAAFGSPVPLPSTSAVQPSDAGPVWKESYPGGVLVAVTFPSQGMFVEYGRPARYADPASGFQGLSANLPSSAVVQLNGTTPALYIPENSDDTGTNFGVVDFEPNGAEVQVFGHNDEATLEAIAQSILNQWPSTSSSTPSGTSSSPQS